MSKGIKLSPNYGVNPTIPVCFWCGKNKNELILMGRIRKMEGGRAVVGSDIEAPHRMVMDYDPCDACAEKFSEGVLCIEVRDMSDGRPPIQKGLYPTGNHAVVTPEGADCVFPQEGKKWQKGQKVLIEDIAFQRVFSDAMSGK